MADNVIVRVPEQQFIRGEDGYSPEVTIEDITHGHRVTITDYEHPVEGQSFDVMDGASAYEQAVAGGYTGAEAQFNEDLANFKFLSYAATSAASEANASAQSANRSELRAKSSERAAEDAAAAALIRMNSAATSAGAAEDASSFFTSTILPNAVNTINSTRDQAVANVNVAKSTAVQNVQTEGATQITAVQTESATQQAAIQQKGEDVLDSIPADYTELTEDVDDLKSAFNMLETRNIFQIAMVKGEYIKGSDPNGGTPVSSTGFTRTKYLYAGYGEKIAIELTNDTYEYFVSYYGENGALDGTGYVGYSGYNSGLFVIPEQAVKIGISFRRVDHHAISTADMTAISNALYFYGMTDISLSVTGKAADAKTTGEAISKTAFYYSEDKISFITSYDSVIAEYDNLCTLYPDYITKNALVSGNFTNYEYVLTLGNYNSQSGQRGQDAEIAKPTILVCAAIHGDENASAMSLLGFVKDMCENTYSLNKIIDSAVFRVIPIVNPWGYSNRKRLNENSVNINRNFNTSDWTLTPTGSNYSGAAAGDQPQTQVVQSWITAHNDAILFIDWHNSAYLNELSCLLGTNNTDNTKLKKAYLKAINKIIPWWIKGRGISASTNIFAYTGSPDPENPTTGLSVTYALEAGIGAALTLETSWNVNDSGQHSKISIGVGQEAFANMMLGFADFIDDTV